MSEKNSTSRTYRLHLADEELEKLAALAGEYNLTVPELLEAFIADLVHGRRSNGSDERELMKEWFDRFRYNFDTSKSLIQYLSSGYEGYDLDEFFERYEYLKAQKDFLVLAKKRMTEFVPEPDMSPEEVEEEVHAYKEGLLINEKQVKDAQASFDEIRKDFTAYMKDKSFDWNEEVESLIAWYDASFPDAEKS